MNVISLVINLLIAADSILVLAMQGQMHAEIQPENHTLSMDIYLLQCQSSSDTFGKNILMTGIYKKTQV